MAALSRAVQRCSILPALAAAGAGAGSRDVLLNSTASINQGRVAQGGGGSGGGARRLASNSPAAPQDTGGSRGGAWSWRGSLLLLPAGIAGYLGTWQVQRRQWKVDLIGERQEMLQQPPVDIFGLDRGPSEYLPVKARGEYQHDQTVYIGPRVKSAMGTTTAGAVVITPLHSKEWHRTILVNRGWVPEGWTSVPRPSKGNNAPDEASGVIRKSERPNSFVPENKPAEGKWFWIDVPSIAEACGLPADTPMLEVFDSSGGLETASSTGPTQMDILARRTSSSSAPSPRRPEYPQPKAIGDLVKLTVMPDDHRNYAMIWFSLSAITAGMAAKVLTTVKKAKR